MCSGGGFGMCAVHKKPPRRAVFFHGCRIIAIHRKFQTRRIAEDSTRLYGEVMQHRMRLSVDGYKQYPAPPAAHRAEAPHSAAPDTSPATPAAARRRTAYSPAARPSAPHPSAPSPPQRGQHPRQKAAATSPARETAPASPARAPENPPHPAISAATRQCVAPAPSAAACEPPCH